MYKRLVLAVAILCLSAGFTAFGAEEKQTLRVLHVMSYHSSWVWNVEQFQGFKDGLGELDVEYQVVELDTKRVSDPEAIEKKADKAADIIRNWKPDLLYTNDDNAQKYLAQKYVGTDLPIVFSGVNRDPSEYGFMGAKNVTGVMEHEHFIPSVHLLRSLDDTVRRIAVIVDTDPTWKGVIARMRAGVKHIPDVEVSHWILAETFSDYQQHIHDLQDKVDAIALLGVFNLKDEHGKDVGYERVLKWTAEHSQLPDFSFWESRVDRGTLCVVAVSGYEQGLIAGEMAMKILSEQISPSAIAIRSSDKGQPMLSLPRAKALGLKLDVQQLLDNTVKSVYAWDM